MTKHIWTKSETQIVLKAYLDRLSRDEVELIAKKNNIPPNAFYMRMANFKYLATNGKKGLSKIKRLEQQVWDEHFKD